MRPLIAIAAIVLAASRANAQTTDILRGLVRGPDSLPRPGVHVTAVSRITADIRATTTDRLGRYALIFPEGGGDYLVAFHQFGLVPLQRQVKRIDDEDVLVADVRMREAPRLLDSVIVIAGRIRPTRPGDDPSDPTASELLLTLGGVPPAQAGSIAALAGEVPGVTRVTGTDGAPDGFSVLGLSPDQNRVTLNGMTVNVSDLPRDAIAGGRVTTTTADPSRGGFSGATLNIRSPGGTTNVERFLTMSVDDSRLQIVERPSSQLGAKYTNLQLSGRSSGPIRSDRSLYAASVQAGRRTSDLRTLLNTSPLALQQLGASWDSVRRASDIMGAAGMPATTAGIPDRLTTLNASSLVRGDWRPTDKRSYSATLTTSWRTTRASRLSGLAMPTHGGADRSLSANLQLSHSIYLASGFLHESRFGMNAGRNTGSPYLALPDARVRVTSAFADDTPGVATLQLAGNSSMPARSSTTSAEWVDDLSWISRANRHRVKLTLELRGDRFHDDQTSNRLGTFSFNSLRELELGEATEFRRQLTAVRRAGDLVSGAVAIGDQYRRSNDLQLQYGLRFDVARFGRRPSYNAAVEQVFGVRNDRAPHQAGFSPRFGFNWTFGTTRQIAAFEGAQRTPRSTLRGSIGEYRNAASSGLIQPAITGTGLPDAIQMLTCRGDAVPVPDWDRYASDAGTVPATCLDGGGVSVFSDRQPRVTLFERGYGVSRSWRANLAWTGSVLLRFNASVEGTYSLNLDQSGSIDLNFRDSVFFRLAGEGARPVFVSPSSIAPGSGGIGSRAARFSEAFSEVSARTSDLRSRSAQLRVGVSPLVASRVRWGVTYVYTATGEERRGFGGTTASGPLALAWGPGQGGGSARHQVTPALSLGYHALSVNVSGRISSGIRFTPMVSGDVNGDGSSNDRAFVFDPSSIRATDSVLAAGVSSLLTAGRPEGRRCLARQLGTVARRGSCVGPWTATVNVSMSLNPATVRLPRRTTASINFNNPLALVDMLVNGKASAGALGQEYNPETTLLYVRGFDSVTRRFRYEVNPRFGDTRSSRAGAIQPFLVTLAFRTDVGPEPARQSLHRTLYGWQTNAAARPTELQLRQQYENPFLAPYQTILRQRDSLQLSTAQAAALTGLMTRYVASIDSTWAPVVRGLVALTGSPDIDAVYRGIRDAQRRSYDLQMTVGPAIRDVLTPEQLRRLPANLSRALDARLIRDARDRAR